MLLNQLFERLLRLFVGCQVWTTWQPGNPSLMPAIFAMPPHFAQSYIKKRKRSC